MTETENRARGEALMRKAAHAFLAEQAKAPVSERAVDAFLRASPLAAPLAQALAVVADEIVRPINESMRRNPRAKPDRQAPDARCAPSMRAAARRQH